MTRSTLRVFCLLALSSCAALVAGTGCNEAPTLRVERLPEVTPDLPEVPTIPPPPEAYPDGSMPIARLRRLMEDNLDHEVQVTGFIVDIYQPPACERGAACPRPLIPHLYIADAANETDETKRMLVIGYAPTQDEYVSLQRLGTRIPANPDGTARSPIDFAVGNKVTFVGNFVTQSLSAAGFNSTAGLVDYARHTTLEAVPAP